MQLLITPNAALAVLLTPFVDNDRGGRPPAAIDYAALKSAASAGLTASQAADAMGISYATFKRRIDDDEQFARIWATRAARTFSPADVRDLAAAGFDKTAAAFRLKMSVHKLKYELTGDHSLGVAWLEGRAIAAAREARAVGGFAEQLPETAEATATSVTVSPEPVVLASPATVNAPRRRPGRKKCRPAPGELDLLAIRAMAAAGLGKGRVADVLQIGVRAFSRLVQEDAAVNRAWEFGRGDHRRGTMPQMHLQ